MITETSRPKSQLSLRQSRAVEQYASLLIRLHEQMRSGDEEGAEEIRERMDAPGLLLNEDEIGLVKGLSADLYLLSGEEVLRPSGSSKRELSLRLLDAYKSHDADLVLTLLRKAERPDSVSSIAYARSIAYGWLGLEEAARAFLLYASELDFQRLGSSNGVLTHAA